MYYLWHNQFSTTDRKVIGSFLFQTLVEYAIFFALLSHHHIIAMIIFETNNWFPATLYFDLLFSAIFLISCIVFLLILRTKSIICPNSTIGRLLCYVQLSYLIFLTLGLDLIKHYDLSALVIFIVISCVFAIGYAYDKAINIGALFSIINNKSAYMFLVQSYFFSLSCGLIFASFLNKFATVAINYHISSSKIPIIILLCLSFLASYYASYLAKFKPALEKIQIQGVYRSLLLCNKELFAKVGLNILVGAFLVKWYFTMPLFLQYSENWSSKHIADAIFIAATLSLIVNWFFLRLFNQYDVHTLFIWVLIVLVFTVLFVAVNLYFHHWVLLCVILMAVFYNSLQSTVNKIVHHDIIKIEVNIILLIMGGVVSLILFSFLVSGMSVFLSKQAGIRSQALEMPILLLTFIIIGVYSFYRLKHHRKQRVELGG